ncbi:ATP-dependent DNA helicase [Catenulispora rubra]|uniref:ATP-dependent DNA helicase n=1 Tax=Catenulispora rubra TaxID=280293 RepID=UPI0018923E57|nr:ATP-dependent DNA helicase [Catenulispora rubra]
MPNTAPTATPGGATPDTLTEAPSGSPEDDLTPLLDAAVEALGGQTRPGQIAMAKAVAASLDDRVHLLVQAGTGTGKSLAYLVPALAHHKRVIVATATLALQRQLVAHDLPRLATAITPLIKREPAFALLKGRNNYVCRNKVEGGAAEDDNQDVLFDPLAVGKLGAEVLRVREWVEETESGDRDDLSPGVSDRAWAQVSVSARECLGSKCQYFEDCFAEQAKELARSADVVVTNHALLAIAAMDSDVQVLPEHDAVIVDEAHELVNRVTSAATGELTKTAVERAHHRADRLVKEVTAANLAVATLDFTEALENTPEGRFQRGLPEEIGMALTALRDASRAALTELSKNKGGDLSADGDDTAGARKQARAACENVHQVAERVLEGAEADVVWLERSEFKGVKNATLKIAPLGIEHLLRFKMFARTPVVLTSATLKLGGDFTGVAGSVGLYGNERVELDFKPELPEEIYDAAVKLLRDGDSDGEEFLDTVQNLPQHWRALDVGSPFDYPKQGILYVARHLDPPGRDGIRDDQLDLLADLMDNAGGRALGLFSSMRAAQTATEKLREKIDLPILCQGEDSLAELLRKFSDDPETCLFGTLSLWQGVNVPGPSLQLVTIDRIPFPRPDDPVSAARTEAVGRSGGNGFMAVSASHAALLLAQGAGRLIRAIDDKGVVAVLDSRLATKPYGGFLRASMPSFWQTDDTDRVLKSLRAIDAMAKTAGQN